jgi:hypothetical protein
MLHIIALQALVVCFIANLELCSNTTNIIVSCCEATYAIMMREPIGVSHLIDRSIKRMIDTIDRWLGHPYAREPNFHWRTPITWSVLRL